MENHIVGILGIQGDFSRHQEVVNRLNYKTLIVKTPEDLQKVDKLIMPGGESTAMRLLLQKHGLWRYLQEFVQTKSVFGTCAGAILLAKNIDTNEESLDAIDIDVKRNSYGRQIDSFTTTLDIVFDGNASTVPAAFIRAPEITRTGSAVKVLATHQNMPVLAQERQILVATFHPELTTNSKICEYFLQQV